MSADSNFTRAAIHLPSTAHSLAELDIFRGLAAVAMIVNHAGYKLLSNESANSGSTGALVFLGSFAPALFFFATGFGVGISDPASRRGATLRAVLYKGGLLVLADQFLWWRAGVPWGLDFLGFIGVSLLLVSVLSLLEHPLRTAAVLAFALVLLRFVVAPQVSWCPADSAFLVWILGSHAQDAISYPASPWLIYPLGGLIAGGLYRDLAPNARAGDLSLMMVALATAVLSLLAAALLETRSASFHRWGTVGVGYFSLSIAVLAFALLLAWVIRRREVLRALLAGLLALRGVASFAVVPVHFLLLDLAVRCSTVPITPVVFASSVVVLLVASLVLSRTLEAALQVGLPLLGRAKWPMLILVTVVSAAVCLLTSNDEQIAGFYSSIAGQFAIGGMLLLRPAWFRTAADVSRGNRTEACRP